MTYIGVDYSPICPVCSGWLEETADGLWLKCRSCGYMTKYSKKIISSMVLGPGISDVDDFNGF